MSKKYTIKEWFARETKRLGRPLRKTEFGMQTGLSPTAIVRMFNGKDTREIRVEDEGNGRVQLWQKNPLYTPISTKDTAGYKR